jgi:hypothetical protein
VPHSKILNRQSRRLGRAYLSFCDMSLIRNEEPISGEICVSEDGRSESGAVKRKCRGGLHFCCDLDAEQHQQLIQKSFASLQDDDIKIRMTTDKDGPQSYHCQELEQESAQNNCGLHFVRPVISTVILTAEHFVFDLHPVVGNRAI